MSTINFKNTSFDLTARLQILVSGTSGVVICQGRVDGRVDVVSARRAAQLHLSYLGHDITTVSAQQPLAEGPATLTLSFD